MKKRLISVFLCLAIIFTISVNAFAEGVQTESIVEGATVASISVGSTGYINGTSVYFRTGPGTNYSYMGKVYKPDSLLVVAAYSGNWYKVTMTNDGFANTTGYVYGNYINAGTTTSQWTVVATSGANLRNGPGTNYTALKQVSYGDHFYITNDFYNSSDGYIWYQVKMTYGTNAGETGYLRCASDIIAYI